RERAIFILSVFIEKVSKEKNSPEFLEAVARLLVNWLQIETEYLSGFPFICLQLQTLLQKMLQLGLWYQTENLIIILAQIQTGTLPKNNLIRQTISKVHSSLAEEAFLKNLVDVYLDKKEDRRDIAQCLLLHFGSKAAAVLVQYLVDCKDREKRFSLLEFIPTTGKVALPVCDFCLKQNPPWYVVRNLIIIISRMEDPKLYEMVRPFLTHKDIRVQLQILNCITKLAGGQMRDRLIEALSSINDELKQQVVVQLGNMGGKDVGNALCNLLEKREAIAGHVRDELILVTCTRIKYFPSERAIRIVKELLTERAERFNEGDPILQAARDTLVSMELKNTGSSTSGPFSSSVPMVPLDDESFKVPFATEEEFDSILGGEITSSPKHLEAPPTQSTPVKKDEKQPVADSCGTPSKEDIIQKAKNDLNDPGLAIHFCLWAKFYEEMTTEEFTAFHTALKVKIYQPNELIIARGDLQAPLFFFDHGYVNLVRNLGGEEVHLNPIGAGDLIGSDIFLTGQAWNLSLYAKEAVTARVFDLEHLLKMQVDFPHLAGRLFSFCSRYDVLQAMLRVFDQHDPAIIERTNILHKGSSGKSADNKIEQGKILKKLRGGLSFSLPTKAHTKINLLLENQLKLSIRLSSGVVDALPATIIGTMRTVAMPKESAIFVRFLQPLPDSLYACDNIEFME
ncbi:MAG: cyclic nucleotide-binding domain-containing protein, partial [Desulforhopalus sp.]